MLGLYILLRIMNIWFHTGISHDDASQKPLLLSSPVLIKWPFYYTFCNFRGLSGIVVWHRLVAYNPLLLIYDYMSTFIAWLVIDGLHYTLTINELNAILNLRCGNQVEFLDEWSTINYHLCTLCTGQWFILRTEFCTMSGVSKMIKNTILVHETFAVLHARTTQGSGICKCFQIACMLSGSSTHSFYETKS